MILVTHMHARNMISLDVHFVRILCICDTQNSHVCGIWAKTWALCQPATHIVAHDTHTHAHIQAVKPEPAT